MKSLEKQIDASLKEYGITPHITHLKQPPDCYYSYITVATRKYESYQDISKYIKDIFLRGSVYNTTGSDLDRLFVGEFAKIGCGVAPCHAVDNFSRSRGRIIAKGRLLKLLERN